MGLLLLKLTHSSLDVTTDTDMSTMAMAMDITDNLHGHHGYMLRIQTAYTTYTTDTRHTMDTRPTTDTRHTMDTRPTTDTRHIPDAADHGYHGYHRQEKERQTEFHSYRIPRVQFQCWSGFITNLARTPRVTVEIYPG